MSTARMVTPWLNSLRFRLGTWRRKLTRSRLSVRRIAEPRDSRDVTVSVVVPVKNAGAELADLIGRMKAQKGFDGVEVVVVDSGSTDGSAETAEALGATLVRIAPEEFSHSYARNLGAKRASGDYVLFTVQDALPPSDGWLVEMFSALKRHQAAAVSCGEQPRPDSDLFYRAISWNHNRFMAPDGRDAILARPASDDPLERRRNAQLSDVACLIGRSLFLRYRHRGNYAEDLDLGLRLTGDGYRLVFLAGAPIVHSHNRPAYYHLRRSYAEHLALYSMLPTYPSVPGDAMDAMADLPRSIAILDRLVGGLLCSLTPPVSTRQLREAVAAGAAAASAPEDGGRPADRDYLDERTRAFLARLPKLRTQRDTREAPAAPSLADGLPGLAGMICDYVDHASQPADEGMLDGFIAGLYKWWALLAGVRLASAYWRGSQGIRDPVLHLLHDELTREV